MEPQKVVGYQALRIEAFETMPRRHKLQLSDGRQVSAQHYASFENGAYLFLTDEPIWPDLMSGWILIDREGVIHRPIQDRRKGDPSNAQERKPEESAETQK